MKILTNKQYAQLREDITDELKETVLRDACQMSGVHSFVVVYDKVRNNYAPQYMKGGEFAYLHNTYEREMAFDLKVRFAYCKYCGIKDKPVKHL
jgi:hypothetical protein